MRLKGEDEPEELAPEVAYLSGIPSYAEEATQVFDAEIAEDHGSAVPSGSLKLPKPGEFPSSE